MGRGARQGHEPIAALKVPAVDFVRRTALPDQIPALTDAVVAAIVVQSIEQAEAMHFITQGIPQKVDGATAL